MTENRSLAFGDSRWDISQDASGEECTLAGGSDTGACGEGGWDAWSSYS